MRILSVICLLIATPAAADSILYTGTPDGAMVMLNGYGYGDLLTTPATLSGFSFFVTDINDGSDLMVKTAVVNVVAAIGTVVYESGWQTMSSNGTTHEVFTQLPSSLTVDPVHTALFLIPGNGTSWLLNATATNRYTGIVGNGWNPLEGTVDGDLTFDRDVAMRLTTVPEPGTLMLLGVGLVGLWRHRRSHTTSAEPHAAPAEKVQRLV